jgi:hypothetical protein
MLDRSRVSGHPLRCRCTPTIYKRLYVHPLHREQVVSCRQDKQAPGIVENAPVKTKHDATHASYEPASADGQAGGPGLASSRERAVFVVCLCLLKLLCCLVQGLLFSSPSKAALTCHAYPKYFIFHLSHRIFRRMHEALNVGKKITNCIVCL